MKKLTTSEFIEKARRVHGNKYDYSKVEYINNRTKVCIICPEHGEFWQNPNCHLSGSDCPKCSGVFMNQEYFIEKAKQVHGNKYDYSKVEYINAVAKVCIICPIHGEFFQSPSKHLNGHGCPECGKDKKKKTVNEFIEKAKQVHGNKYDYSKVNYVNCEAKVCIICSKHGEFWQTPSSHLRGCGCNKCSGNFMNREYFIEKARQIYGDKYNYSKVEYINALTKICIICPKHGEFWQTPNNHLSGYGCPKCGFIKRVLNRKDTLEYFIEKARKIHGNKYDYSKVNYINSKTKVYIICPEHGEFWQMPRAHLRGKGCSKCNMSHLERDVMQFLDRHNVEYEYQKRFKWLGLQSLDFYLPKYNIAIECQGIQHFIPINIFGGEDEFEKLQKRDKKKKQLCEEHGIKLRYYK